MLREGQPGSGRTRRSRAAARAGLAATVITGLAIAAGVAGLSVLAHTGASQSGSRASGTQAHGTPVPPLRVVSVLPAASTSRVNGNANVEIAFSSPLAPGSTVPSFQPPVPGRWQSSGTVLSFTPTVPFAPNTRYTLRIPAGKSGLRSANGGLIAKSMLISFRTAG